MKEWNTWARAGGGGAAPASCAMARAMACYIATVSTSLQVRSCLIDIDQPLAELVRNQIR
jgi:hypothetical protein